MKKLNKDYLGWVVAAAVGGLFLASGFEAPADKTAVVDVAKVAEDCDAGKAAVAVLQKQKKAREDVIQFMDQNRVIAPDELKTLTDLSLKDTPSDSDKTQLAALQAQIKANTAKLTALTGKTDLTPQDRAIANDYASRAQQIDQVIGQLFQQYSREMGAAFDAERAQMIDKARAAAKDLGKAQGYTLVFDANVAPYGANDLTDATIAALNSKK